MLPKKCPEHQRRSKYASRECYETVNGADPAPAPFPLGPPRALRALCCLLPACREGRPRPDCSPLNSSSALSRPLRNHSA